MRVLVVEDQVFLAEAVQTALRREAITADVAHDGDDALAALEVVDYDVVVLDRDIPGTHGDDVCRVLAGREGSPRVLMLTAATRLHEKVSGFELGADDYLAKPFEMAELVVRLRALHRRNGPALPPVLDIDGLALDAFRREVYRDGRLVRLSRKEFAVLEVLMRARGGVVSAESLLEKAWDANADPFTNAPRVVISVLRRKLGEPSVITTVAGTGYRIETGARS
ncbi:response regulator transcription factor [Cellulomonas cellasea]|uniref:Transcriptional regulator n=2 Tax=Cellulomonas cellasea TaxID=43670 RepID=A0A0A0B6K6_9CELL|nr:response regulator transcription factor [Cellulomonas cellasea]KGM00906.1 transcriptional regulator [Cellulomonas cellasea DSM 20118]GEA87205.1 DNA-binding response regulator [Cellulomonas cellasea]